jgi:hypothetical protein
MKNAPIVKGDVPYKKSIRLILEAVRFRADWESEQARAAAAGPLYCS